MCTAHRFDPEGGPRDAKAAVRREPVHSRGIVEGKVCGAHPTESGHVGNGWEQRDEVLARGSRVAAAAGVCGGAGGRAGGGGGVSRSVAVVVPAPREQCGDRHVLCSDHQCCGGCGVSLQFRDRLSLHPPET